MLAGSFPRQRSFSPAGYLHTLGMCRDTRRGPAHPWHCMVRIQKLLLKISLTTLIHLTLYYNVQASMSNLTVLAGMERNLSFTTSSALNLTTSSLEPVRPNNLPLQIWYSAIAIIGCLGNSLTIIAIAVCRKHRKTQNIYIGSLAVSDLLVCLSLAPYTASSLADETAAVNRNSDSMVCRVVGMVSVASIGNTIIHLAAIAVNRYICILKPAHVYTRLYTTRRLFVSIFILWCLSIGSLMPGLFGFGSFGYSELYGTCGITDDPITNLMVLTVIVVPCTIPSLCVTFYSYIRIIIHYRNISRNLRKPGPIPSSTTDGTERRGQLKRDAVQSTRTNKEFAVTVNLCVVFVAFLFCWGPGNIVYILHDNGLAVPLWLHRVTFTLAVSNSCINVFIYAGMNKSFRRTYYQILSCNLRAINNEWLESRLTQR